MKFSLKNHIRLDSPFLVAITIVTIRVLLDYVYLNFVQPSYEYLGFTANPTAISLIISYALLIPSIYLVLPYFKYDGLVVSNMVLLLYLIGFVPTTCIIGCVPQPPLFIVANAVYWFLILILPLKINVRNIKLQHVPIGVVILIGLFFSLIVIYISGTYANFRLTLSLENVYEYREQARHFPLSKITTYLWSASRLVLPIVVSFCLMKKRYLASAYFILVLVLNYSIDGMKSTLASLIICLILFFFVKNDIKNKYPILILIIIFIALTEYNYMDYSFASDYLLRRNLYFTSIMDTKYFDLIQETGPRFYSNEVYGKDIAFYVGEDIFNSDGMRANNGLFSDAYMNLGFLGCLLYPLIYAYLFKLSDSLLRHANKGLVLLLCLLWAYKMRGTTITTVLLTHGVFITIVVLALMPPSRFITNKQSS